MQRSSGSAGASIPGRNALTTGALLLAAAALLISALPSPGLLRAQAVRAGAENAPRFLRIGKTYVNMAAISHAISDPGFGLPPATLQVYFGGQSYVNLYGEDADTLRRLLDGGTTTASGTKAADAPAAGAATAPVSVKKPPAKKAVPRTEAP
ncbi:MAG: hypothetical protein P4L84_01475 [Isosphaeraceae bacterium]|nr:hypothetical protein [Isosphaeraceae bacterium]